MKTKVLFAAMMLMAGVKIAHAGIEDFQIGSYTYTDAFLETNDGNRNTVLIKHCNNVQSQMVLPRYVTYNGITYKVMGVDNTVFCEDKTIKSLTIPNDYCLKKGAFAYSKNLEEIILGDSIELIDGCFGACPAIQKVYFTGKFYSIRKDSFVWLEESTIQRGFYIISSVPPMVLRDRELNESVYKQVTLFVPTNAVGKYKADSFWGKFKIRGWDANAFMKNQVKRE